MIPNLEGRRGVGEVLNRLYRQANALRTGKDIQSRGYQKRECISVTVDYFAGANGRQGAVGPSIAKHSRLPSTHIPFGPGYDFA